MQCGETLLHGCATFGYSELLKELATQYHLDINQPNLVRTDVICMSHHQRSCNVLLEIDTNG